MRKHIFIVVCLIMSFNISNCFQVAIGNGNDQNQHIPSDPWYNHSGSQLIYNSDYFPYGGLITEISFQYYFYTPNPENFLNNITLMLGESQLESFADANSFISLDELEVCFEGELSTSNFQFINNAGDGWLTIYLDQPFEYTKTGNLILFFSENNSAIGNNGDDFVAFSTPQNTSMCFIDTSNPLDLDNLVAPQFIRNCLPNTIFHLTIDEVYPQVIAPVNSAEDVALDTHLQIQVESIAGTEISFYSQSNTFDLLLEDNYQLISAGTYEITPQLPFAPNSYYEWDIIYNQDGSQYQSQLSSFTTEDEDNDIELSNIGDSNYSLEFTWNSLCNNQYPYTILRNDEVIAVQYENSFVDTEVISGESYEYQVKFYYLDDSYTESNICIAEVDGSENTIIDENFESYDSFQTNLGTWQNLDFDGHSTYVLAGCNYLNQGTATAFVVFEPAAVTPPLDLNIEGEKCLVSFASLIAPTSDILISPPVNHSQVDIDVYLKSYNIAWGMERVKYGVVYNNDLDNLVCLNDGEYCEIPAEMTHLTLSHHTDDINDRITNFWLESCGVQTLMLIIDRIVITTSETSNDNEIQSASENIIFPNPASKASFELTTTRANSEVKIYNLRGQLIHKTKTLAKSTRIDLPRGTPSGVYMIKIKSDEGEMVKKFSIIK